MKLVNVIKIFSQLTSIYPVSRDSMIILSSLAGNQLWSIPKIFSSSSQATIMAETELGLCLKFVSPFPFSSIPKKLIMVVF